MIGKDRVDFVLNIEEQCEMFDRTAITLTVTVLFRKSV
jgi:hypothetical protein